MPPPAHRHVAAEHFTRLLHRFAAQLQETSRSPAPDPIHDLRVSIRRFDQILSTLKDWFDSRKLQTVRRQLKTLFDAAGDVRDCDIAIDLIARSGLNDVAEIAEALHVRRKGAEHRLAASMRGMIRRRAAASWHTEFSGMQPPAEAESLSWHDLARREIPPRAERFFRTGTRALKKGSAGALHKFRIAAKKFRYTFELFEDAYGPAAEPRLEHLRAVQNILGDINDIRTLRGLAREFGGAKELKARLRRQQRRRIAQFRSLWEAHFPPTVEKNWLEFFLSPPRKPMARAERPVLKVIAAR